MGWCCLANALFVVVVSLRNLLVTDVPDGLLPRAFGVLMFADLKKIDFGDLEVTEVYPRRHDRHSVAGIDGIHPVLLVDLLLSAGYDQVCILEHPLLPLDATAHVVPLLDHLLR